MNLGGRGIGASSLTSPSSYAGPDAACARPVAQTPVISVPNPYIWEPERIPASARPSRCRKVTRRMKNRLYYTKSSDLAQEAAMQEQMTRRESLKRSFAAAGVLAFAEFALPALTQDEVDVPFTDIPANFNPANPNAAVRMLDIRKIDGMFTPKEQFFAMQHMTKP